MLFSPQDLVPLAECNLGLRLTSKLDESTNGGTGDVIPLSHLAGAQDIIEFITLSFLSASQQHTNRMLEIYGCYKEVDIESTDCMPQVLLHYAAQHNIDDAKERLSYKKSNGTATYYSTWQLWCLESEAKKLTTWYLDKSMPYSLEHVITHLPVLSEALAHNFNEQLQHRLTINWEIYATGNDMDYLLLTDHNDSERYTSGYDFNHYPLGKIGRREFNASNVVKQHMFLGGENRTPQAKKELETRLITSIKSAMTNKLNAALSELEKDINNQLTSHAYYPEELKKTCRDMISLVARLQENKQLSAAESIDLMQQTAKLIRQPREYQAFIQTAHKYSMVSGGELSAYMMLLAGWAAKIISLNHAGNTWVMLANEKLDFFSTTRNYAQASESYVQNLQP